MSKESQVTARDTRPILPAVAGSVFAHSVLTRRVVQPRTNRSESAVPVPFVPGPHPDVPQDEIAELERALRE